MTVVVKCPQCESTEIEKSGDAYRCRKCGYSAGPIDEIEKPWIMQAINIANNTDVFQTT